MHLNYGTHIYRNILSYWKAYKNLHLKCLKNGSNSIIMSLSHCSLPDLMTRREFLNLCLFYKIVYGLCDFSDFPLQRRVASYPHMNLSDSSFVLPFAKSNYFFYFFFFLLLYSRTPYHPLLNVPHLFIHLTLWGRRREKSSNVNNAQ